MTELERDKVSGDLAVTSGGSQLWAFSSGKGGVGKSFLAANMAWLLARDVGPVALVDLDISGANLHTHLGISSSRLERRDGASILGDGCDTGIPGLRLHPLAGAMCETRAKRRALLTSLEQSATPFVVMDLASGGQGAVTDFFLAADRALMVLLPEPASVENAHQFARQLHQARVQRLLQQWPSDLAVRKRLRSTDLVARPEEWLDLLERALPGGGAIAQRYFATFVLYVVVNQVRHESDVAVGVSLRHALGRFFGMTVRYAGAVPFDKEVWLSTRRRRLRTRESNCDELGLALERVITCLREDVEAELPSLVTATW